MSQITLPRLPQAPEEYNASQINQLVTSLDQLIRLLNSSYTPEQLRNDDEAVAWFIGQMANTYKNYKMDLVDTDNESVYTVPDATTGIIKSILVSEDAGATPTITLTLVDSSAAVFSLFKTKALTANGTLELLTEPLVVQQNEIIKAQASAGNELHIVISVLEIS